MVGGGGGNIKINGMENMLGEKCVGGKRGERRGRGLRNGG